jgi:hypothetical protein
MENDVIQFYRYTYRCNNVTRIISELKSYITSPDVTITVVNFPRDSKLPYYNTLYGSLLTLQQFKFIKQLTFIDEPKKMYKRIHQHLNASKKKRKLTLQGISKLLLDSKSCRFYTQTVDITINNSTNQVTNMLKLGIITTYYSTVKEKMPYKRKQRENET